MKKLVGVFIGICIVLSLCGCQAVSNKAEEPSVSDESAVQSTSLSQSRIPEFKPEFYYGMAREEVQELLPDAEPVGQGTSLMAYDITSDLAIVKLARERDTEVRIMYHFDEDEKLNSITCTASSSTFTKEDMYRLAEQFYDSYGGPKDPKITYESLYTIYEIELESNKGTVIIDYELNDVSSKPSIGVTYDMPGLDIS